MVKKDEVDLIVALTEGLVSGLSFLLNKKSYVLIYFHHRRHMSRIRCKASWHLC